jgi:formylglycine-generating enzyme required for sulfatase activity
MASLSRLAVAVLLSAALSADPAGAQDPSAPAPAPSPAPAVPGGEAAADLAALKKEMEETYLQVQRDFEALAGAKSAETIIALLAAHAEEVAAAGSRTVTATALAEGWAKRGILGPVVAGRLAARAAEAADAAPDRTLTAAHLAASAKQVFPEPTMADNWDRHFVDLDVVRRWVKARAAEAPATPADKGAAPTKPAPPAAPDPADMVLVPKGELQVPDQRGRGWQDSGQKAEKRTVKAFYIDRTETTCAAYAAFLRGLKDARIRERVLPAGWKLDEKGAPILPECAATLPVAGIPYEGAKAFADSLGKRLPTEDEWERAARGGADSRYPWGNDWVEGNAVAGGKPGPAAVGTTAGDRSSFGVLDMAGNVSEICATYPDGRTVKGIPKATEQVVRRGGNFRESPDEAANDWRYVIGPTARSELVGFRCAMDERDYERRYGKK